MTEEEFIMLRLKKLPHCRVCVLLKSLLVHFITMSCWEVHLSWMAVWWDGLLHPVLSEDSLLPPISYDVSSHSYAASHNFWRTLSLFRPSNPARALSSWKRSCCVKPCTLTLSFMLVGQKLGLKVETDHSGTFADLMCINVGADFIFPSRSALICFTLCTWLILQKCTIF